MRAFNHTPHQRYYNAVCLAFHHAVTSGGTTVDLSTDEVAEHSTGYWVGTKNLFTGEIITALDFHSVAYDLERIGGRVTVDSSSDKPAFLGSWIDPGTDLLYLDLTVHCEDLNEAVNIGKLFDQIAIWGIENSELIRL